MYIGGGRIDRQRASRPTSTACRLCANPYVTGIALLAAGNGGSRDAGAGPAFTGFGDAAAGGDGRGGERRRGVEAGFANRSGVALVDGQSVFSSEAAAQAIGALREADAEGEPTDAEFKQEFDAGLADELTSATASAGASMPRNRRRKGARWRPRRTTRASPRSRCSATCSQRLRSRRHGDAVDPDAGEECAMSRASPTPRTTTWLSIRAC